MGNVVLCGLEIPFNDKSKKKMDYEVRGKAMIRDEFEKQWKCDEQHKCTNSDFKLCRDCKIYKRVYLCYLESHTYLKTKVDRVVDEAFEKGSLTDVYAIRNSIQHSLKELGNKEVKDE